MSITDKHACSCCPETIGSEYIATIGPGWTMIHTEHDPSRDTGNAILCPYCTIALEELIRSGMLATLEAPGYHRTNENASQPADESAF